jgi:hypothetical protein
MTLISVKTKTDALNIVCLKKMFQFFIIFDIITTHKFIKIYVSTPSYVYYKILN